MNKEEIFKILNEHKGDLYERFGVKKVGLFGSYANNTYTETSDIDIYAEFESTKFRNIAGAWSYFEEILMKKIDLLYPHQNMRKALQESLQKSVIYG